MLRRTIVRVKLRALRVAKHPKVRKTIQSHVTHGAITSLTTCITNQTVIHKGHVTPDLFVDFLSTQALSMAIEISKIGVHILLK